jgi:peptidoglycan-associated lipoprotein
MNNTVRVAFVALMCVGAAACSKKQELKTVAPPPEKTTPTQTKHTSGK